MTLQTHASGGMLRQPLLVMQNNFLKKEGLRFCLAK